MDIAEDGKPLDYQDEKGKWHIMCACGHRVTGSVKLGDRITLCPNCSFTGRHVGGSFPIIYPDRMITEQRTVVKDL